MSSTYTLSLWKVEFTATGKLMFSFCFLSILLGFFFLFIHVRCTCNIFLQVYCKFSLNFYRQTVISLFLKIRKDIIYRYKMSNISLCYKMSIFLKLYCNISHVTSRVYFYSITVNFPHHISNTYPVIFLFKKNDV